MNRLQSGRKLLAGTLLAGLMILPMAVTAQEAGHDHHGQGHADHGTRNAHGGHGDHAGHGAHDGHAGHDMGPRITRGSWSYLDRDNPEPYAEGRWVMVPMPGVEAGYRFVRSMGESAVCASLDDPRIIVDRATRETCRANPAALPFTGVAVAGDHGVHGDHHDHGGHRHIGHDGHPGHRDHGAGHEGHGDHGAHDHGAQGGHAWVAPREAVTMQNPVRADRDSLRRGESVYQAFCMTCHGAQARGDGPAAGGLATPPADLVTHLAHHTDGDYAWKIRTGNGDMPAFGSVLSEQQTWDVVNYLRSLGEDQRDAGGHAH